MAIRGDRMRLMSGLACSQASATKPIVSVSRPETPSLKPPIHVSWNHPAHTVQPDSPFHVATRPINFPQIPGPSSAILDVRRATRLGKQLCPLPGPPPPAG